jgi:hypothetical protein
MVFGVSYAHELDKKLESLKDRAGNPGKYLNNTEESRNSVQRLITAREKSDLYWVVLKNSRMTEQGTLSIASSIIQSN